MKRFSWLVVTVITVGLTGVVMTQVRWAVASHAARSVPRRIELHGHAKTADPLASQAAARWRRCQPVHWRACLLQR